jgi:phosphoribosylamine---glycine ligase
MDVLVIGSGGREHALCWKLRQSPRLGKLWCAPGNAGITDVAACVPLDITDHAAVVRFCDEQDIGFVVVGPEGPLVAGLADSLVAESIMVFGPTAAAAQLEGSKAFTKALCDKAGIPTAGYARFDAVPAALAYIAGRPLPIVVKADGLAAGKGVVIAESHAEAAEAATRLLADPGSAIVIEDFLTGEEASFFAICDGEHAIAFGSAQDHKRVGEGDTGPNTGGMGAYSPAAVMTDQMTERTMREIIDPTVRAMAAGGMPFRGILFAGLMIGADGPKLIEYNVRFGDPECQVLMARLESDLLEILYATVSGQLDTVKPKWRDAAALAVVMAADGYPATPVSGTAIGGIRAAEATGAQIFHAGTARDTSGQLIATGGRVLAVTAIGDSVTKAQSAAYAGVDAIEWPGGFCRRDIGWRAAEREQA